MGKKFLKIIDEDHVYVCSKKGCGTHLSSPKHTVSKLFQGRYSKAYLFKKVANIVLGPIEVRSLITGSHVVADIYCANCQSYIGWKYFHASNQDQKYKVDHFILEISRLKSLKREICVNKERPHSRRSTTYQFSL